MKRIMTVLLTVILILGMTGCSAVFMNTYHSEREFQGNEKIALDSNVQVVQNYNALRRLVFNMVNNHIESEELVFSGYTGNVVSDVASVCNAVKTESSYGAYCVEYISYDLRQIVSSYEAVITISYLYTPEELQMMRTISDMDGFGALLVQALREEQPKLVVRVNNGVSDKAAVEDFMRHTVRNDPMAISYTPEMSVKVFDGNTSQKIYDVSIKYNEERDNEKRLKDMAFVLKTAADGLKQERPDKTVLSAAEYLRDHCAYVTDGACTAYDALVAGSADSQGIACGFKALCDALGIECMVVSGRMDKQDHYWNIVKVHEDYYHMDATLFAERGGESTLFLRDADKQADCWWNQSDYPDCEGALTYTLVAVSE